MSETIQKDNLEGEIIDGRWQVLSMLGAGATSKVYLAKDLEIERTVAVKILNGSASASERVRRRFSQEIRNLSKLTHENIIKPYKAGHHNNQLYVVFDYVEGQTLQAAVKAGPLDRNRIISITIQIASALQQAHSHGIIHRDIKPSNVWLTRTSRPDRPELVKLLDFGISQLHDDSQSQSHSGSTCGTPEYMSPEQCQGSLVDHRTDIYSTGCLLYELMTGSPPFAGASNYEVFEKHLRMPVPSIANCSSPALAAVALRCLQKDPGKRYQSASELEHALYSCTQKNVLSKKTVWTCSLAAITAVVIICVIFCRKSGFQVHLGTPNNALEQSEYDSKIADFEKRFYSNLAQQRPLQAAAIAKAACEFLDEQPSNLKVMKKKLSFARAVVETNVAAQKPDDNDVITFATKILDGTFKDCQPSTEIIAQNHLRRGLAYLSNNDLVKAENDFESSQREYQSIHNHDGIASAQVALAKLADRKGHYGEATKLLSSAADTLQKCQIEKQHGLTFLCSSAIQLVSDSMHRREDAEANERYSICCRMMSSDNHSQPGVKVMVPMEMAKIEFANKKYESAIDLAERTIKTPEYRKDRSLISAALLLTEAQAALVLRRLQLADERTTEGIALCKTIFEQKEGDRPAAHDTMIQLVTVNVAANLAMGRPAESVNCCKAAQKDLADSTNPILRSNLYISLGQLYAANKQFKQAIAAFQTASDIFKQQNNQPGVTACASTIAKLRRADLAVSSVNPVAP